MGEAPELISSNYRNEHGEFTDEGTTLATPMRQKCICTG